MVIYNVGKKLWLLLTIITKNRGGGVIIIFFLLKKKKTAAIPDLNKKNNAYQKWCIFIFEFNL